MQTAPLWRAVQQQQPRPLRVPPLPARGPRPQALVAMLSVIAEDSASPVPTVGGMGKYVIVHGKTPTLSEITEAAVRMDPHETLLKGKR